jgi:hypothetical protein
VRSGRYAGIRFHGGEQVCARQTHFPEASANLGHADAPASFLSAQGGEEHRGGGIDPQPEDMNGLRPPGGGDFNARDEVDAMENCACSGFFQAGYRVVIGQAQDLDAGRGGVGDELERRE